jgi:hypothetical protein
MHRNLGHAAGRPQAALTAAAAAAAEVHLARRWTALDRALDLNRFVTFLAMEVMLGHRDGYGCGRNNFRIYHDPGSDKLVFLPDGMDQLFGLPEFPWRPRMAGLLAAAVLETPEGRALYRERFADLLDRILVPSKLTNRVDELLGRLQSQLTRAEFGDLAREAGALKERIVQRRLGLERFDGPIRSLWRFGTTGRPRGWSETDGPRRRTWPKVKAPTAGQPANCRRCGTFSAAWRTKVVLDPGRYRFEGLVMAAGVKPLPFGRRHGAALRVAGEPMTGERLTADSGWRTLTTEFEVRSAGREVELLCELRASGGQMCVDRDSLRLVRLTPGKP